MKKKSIVLLLLFAVITIYSCNTSSNVKNKSPKFEIAGYYTMGGHDESYSMFVEVSEEGVYTAKFSEIEGMLPPPEMFDEVFEFKNMEKFKLNAETMEFTSKNGNGVFENTDGVWVVFSDKKDFMDEALKMQLGE